MYVLEATGDTQGEREGDYTWAIDDVPDPAPVRAALIGGTALAHGMQVVTRDRKDFDRFEGVEVLDPWR